MLPSLALTHGYLEDMGKMVGSEVTSLQEEKGTMDRLTGDVLSIVLEREREREKERERGGGEGREGEYMTKTYTLYNFMYVYTCAYDS